MVKILKEKSQQLKKQLSNEKKIAKILSTATILLLVFAILPTAFYGVLAQKQWYTGFGYYNNDQGTGYGYSDALPNCPTNFVCTKINSNVVSCTWTTATQTADSTPLDNFEAYEIYYSTNQNNANRTSGLATMQSVPLQTTGTSIGGLTPNTTYYFAIYTKDDNMNYCYPSLPGDLANATTDSTRSGSPGSSGPSSTPTTPDDDDDNGDNGDDGDNGDSGDDGSTSTTPGYENLQTSDPAPAAPLPVEVSVGQLVKRADMPAVYFLDNDNRRHAFPNDIVYFSWFENFDNVEVVSDATLAQIPLGSNVTMRPGTWLIKIQTVPNVYAVEPYGIIRWVQTEEIANALYGPNWNQKIVDVDPSFFTNYQIGPPINSATHPEGSVIQYDGDSNIYIIEAGNKRLITNDVFIANLFQNRFVNTGISADIIYPDGTALPIMAVEVLMALL